MLPMINAGKYNKRITVYKVEVVQDSEGFDKNSKIIVLEPWASVKTTRGYTMIVNNSDFEKAFTNFTIRYSQTIVDAYYDAPDSNRDLLIDYNGKTYKVQYLNNIDENNVELEMQAKEVLK